MAECDMVLVAYPYLFGIMSLLDKTYKASLFQESCMDYKSTCF